MRATPALAAVAVVFLSGAHCGHAGGAGSQGAQLRQYNGWPKEIPGLSLRGNGCHVEVLAPDGSVICSAIVGLLPKCAPFNVSGTGADGGWIHQRFSLGSDCPAPRFSSGTMGPGGFFVEGASGVFAAVCDDLSACERRGHREHILECCRQDKSIQGTALCDVPPDDGVCLEADDGEIVDARELADHRRDAGTAP